MMKVNLETCDWFNFVIWEPAYCSWCSNWVAYDIKNWKAMLPEVCPKCNWKIHIDNSTGSLWNVIFFKHSHLNDKIPV